MSLHSARQSNARWPRFSACELGLNDTTNLQKVIKEFDIHIYLSVSAHEKIVNAPSKRLSPPPSKYRVRPA